MKSIPIFALVLACIIPVGLSAQDSLKPSSAQICASCHQLDESQAGSDLRGPPLFYAGNKYRSQWLEKWLQSPYRIRPAGGFYADHVRTVEGVDSVDESSLDAHMSFDQKTAKELTDWLMSLTPFTELASQSADYEPGSVSPRLGAMDFVKFKGCGGCHRDTPEYGGLTGPELYTAWQRLQPEYIISYIKNPQSWDRDSAMPNRGLNDEQIHKLANYLRTIGQEE